MTSGGGACDPCPKDAAEVGPAHTADPGGPAHPRRQAQFKVLSPTAILGYGFPVESFARGMARRPDLIAVDAGSTDPGPYYLGMGKSFTNRAAVKRDLEIMLEGALGAAIPLVIGSAGGCGAREHVEWTRAILEEIARERSHRFRMAIVWADIPRVAVMGALRDGRIRQVSAAVALTPEALGRTDRIVAQMGVEPLIAALDGPRGGLLDWSSDKSPDGPLDVILAGRSYDPAPFAAPAIRAGFDPGLALHMGKILECAAIAATPGSGADSVLGTLEADSFVLEALDPGRRFTKTSAAAHTLYEKSDPYRLPGPGGMLDLTAARFIEVGDGTVRVTGSRFVPDDLYTIKLEGAALVGYRTVSIAGIRDPGLIAQIDSVLEKVRELAARAAPQVGSPRLFFHLYGRDAIMGPREPLRDRLPHELGLIIEALAPTQDQADTLCAFARSTLLHYGYPGRISTAGNLAFLYSPSDMPAGPVFEFSVYHLMEVDDPLAPFPIEFCQVGE